MATVSLALDNDSLHDEDITSVACTIAVTNDLTEDLLISLSDYSKLRSLRENKRTEHNNNVTLLNSHIERPVEQGYDTVMQVDSVDATPDITYAESNDLIFVNNIDTSVNVDPVLTEAKGIKSVTPYIDVKSEMYEFRKAQREDPSLKHIFDQLKDKNNINSDYFVLDMDGLLYRSTVVNDCEIRQLVAPESR